MLRSLIAAASVLALASTLPAQNCGAGQTLLKNDTLPGVPTGIETVAVV